MAKLLIQFVSLCSILFGLSECIRLEQFYPFGTAAGDAELDRADDGSFGPLRLEEAFPYFDGNERNLYVSREVGLAPLTLYSARSTPSIKFLCVARTVCKEGVGSNVRVCLRAECARRPS